MREQQADYVRGMFTQSGRRWLSHESVLAGDLSEERGADLGRALLGGEVDVDDAVAVAGTSDPFQVVLSAPLEVTLHRDAVSRGPRAP